MLLQYPNFIEYKNKTYVRVETFMMLNEMRTKIDVTCDVPSAGESGVPTPPCIRMEHDRHSTSINGTTDHQRFYTSKFCS